MRLGNRIMGGFLLPLAILFLVSLISFRGVVRLSELSHWVRRTQGIQLDLEKTFGMINSLQAAQRDYVITGDKLILQEMEGIRTRLGSSISTLRASMSHPSERAQLDQLERLIRVRVDFAMEIIRARSDHGFEAAARLVSSGKGRRLMQQIRASVESIQVLEDDFLSERIVDADELARFTFLVAAAGCVLTLLTLLVGSRFIIRSITLPLQELLQGTKRLELGELDYRVPVRREDELGWLARQLNEMAGARMASEGRLRAVIAALNTVVRSSPLAIIGFDPEMKVTLWNTASERLLGWESRQVIGEAPRFIAPDGPDAGDRLFRRALGGQMVLNAETFVLRQDGERLPVRVSASPLVNAERIDGAMAILEDIRELKEAERARARVLERERQLSRQLEKIAYASLLITEQSTDGAGDPDRVLRNIVEQARSVTEADFAALGIGLDPSRPFDQWVYSGVSPEEARRIGRNPRPVGLLGWVARHGQSLRIDDLRESPMFQGMPQYHAQMKAYLGVPIRHEGRAVGNLYLANREERSPFTEQDQKAMELLAAHAGVVIENARLYKVVNQERSRLRLLSDISAVLVGTLDFRQAVSTVARMIVPRLADLCTVEMLDPAKGAFQRVAVAADDLERERAVRELAEYYPMQTRWDRPVGRALKSGQGQVIPEISELLLHGISLDSRHEELYRRAELRSGMIVPLSVGDRLIGGLILVSRLPGRFGPDNLALAEEVGRRAALAIENARLFSESRRAVQAREDVLAMVSHDLKNPLSSIRAGAELLSMKAALPEFERRQLHVISSSIRRSTDRMLGMIGDLLDAASIESGRFAVRSSVQDTTALLRDIHEEFRPLADQKGLVFELRETPRLPDAFCDGGRIRQVFSNLIGNAIKFTPSGGKIVLEAGVLGEQVRFAVSDTGPGISREHQAHLFERYWRVQDSEQRGTGLGLYIAKGIAEAHGGSIWAESEPGRGTKVSFSVPIARDRGARLAS